MVKGESVNIQGTHHNVINEEDSMRSAIESLSSLSKKETDVSRETINVVISKLSDRLIQRLQQI